jgi:hypothetical protein
VTSPPPCDRRCGARDTAFTMMVISDALGGDPAPGAPKQLKVKKN